jgi:hypothetical protein
MKTNKIFAMAAFAATVLSAVSCQKGGIVNPSEEGAEAKMGITITFPRSGSTRAVDTNASAQDMIVSSIDVFIFNNDGSAAKGNDLVNLGLFEKTGDNKWTLKDESLITTTAGTKRIYVGVNLPAGLNGASTESALMTAYNGVGSLYSNTDDQSGVAMLSPVTVKDVVTGASDKNLVSVSVVRMAAKVTATMGSSYNAVPSAVKEPKFTVHPDRYTVGNTALSVYPVKRMNGSNLVTPGDNDNGTKTDVVKTVADLDIDANPQVDINPDGTAGNLKTGRYVPEHSTSTNWLRGESTYAVVRGELKPSKYSKFENGGVNEEYADAPATFTVPVWAIRYSGRVYFTENVADRDAIAAHFNLPNGGVDYFQEYIPAAGRLYTFYYVFIAENEVDKLAVHRNRIYDVIVNSVKGIGQPGMPAKPHEPDRPVYTTDAELDVEVTVEDWTYVPAPSDLQ